MEERWTLRDALLICGAFAAMAVCFSAAAAVGILRAWPLLLLGPAVGYFLWRKVPPVTWMNSVQREYEQAAWFGDDATARQLASDLMTELRRWSHAPWMADLLEAGCLAFQEKYKEAAGLISRVDFTSLNDASRTVCLNSLAWCKAHLGEAESAVEVAREALKLAETAANPVANLCRGTLGTALVIAGDAEQAIPLLEQAINSNARRPAQLSCHAYYLAVACWNLGRAEEARSWLERAVAAAPETRYGRRATATLQNMMQQTDGEEHLDAEAPPDAEDTAA